MGNAFEMGKLIFELKHFGADKKTFKNEITQLGRGGGERAQWAKNHKFCVMSI